MSNIVLGQMGRTARIIVADAIRPDYQIGGSKNPYMNRWHLAKDHLYLHQILRDDDDSALHDHPWDFSVYIIEGSYKEIRVDCPEGELFEAGSYRHIKAETAHRIVVVNGPVWTLCFIGPRRREWGFHCPKGWIHWEKFVSKDNKGEHGLGCNQEI